MERLDVGLPPGMQIGMRFGRLVIVGPATSTKSGRYVACRCDCGAQVSRLYANVRSGYTRSCGCLLREVTANRSRTHGHAPDVGSSPTYASWSDMLTRCRNPKRKVFKDYGGRGITVCDRWLTFENFLADMGERPLGLTLERIKNHKGYEPGNCKWATYRDQARNRRSTKLTLDRAIDIARRSIAGERQRAIAGAHGVSVATVKKIVNGGAWPEARAIARGEMS